MPKVTITKTSSLEAPLLIEYECECGRKVQLHTDIKPKRLPKCFDCLVEDKELFAYTKSKKCTVKPKFKKDMPVYRELF